MGEMRVGLVGGGILGVAIAREVVRRRPGTEVVVLEKEDRLAAHQTGHSSGVVHAGIYYKPGSLKAELCARGRTMLRDFCAEHSIAYDACGKLVVAVDREEMGRFDALAHTATDNGVPGLRRLAAGEIGEVEPHAGGLAALHSPETAITDYTAITQAMADDVFAGGGGVRLGAKVVDIRRRADGATVQVEGDPTPLHFDHVVVAAGLHADRVSALVDGERGPAILRVPRGVPRREHRQAGPGAGDGLPRPGPALPVPRRPLHPPSHRGARGRPQRCPRHPARGLPAARRLRDGPPRGAGVARLLAPGP
ncbi:FAD-dependent oxidoreductase [Nocardioides renjunii]|uniref:FAD-dependent oxidoreductase n=1 Tax=Nocardioides renjunii TaxID=3095075 RepID=UPI002AFE5851|nr:FAD-dependent oxidoreductase [Nocardioides sp. S-34]